MPFGDKDETHRVAKEFASGSNERHDRFVRETSTEKTSYHRMQAQIRKYIEEIEALERSYPALYAAKSEVDRYQSKVETLAEKVGTAEEKKHRNVDKHSSNMDEYKSQLASMLAAQKGA